ncbi:phosphatase PAP2 family protein [Ectobacillus ponti]|uniref:Phosphatase PAP2 family protein n=1 Tax=Ectobacillus ponti TaxID=2961894 RepID=A0AA42BP75_9BACI|nr:phosphatase PAP2 family protein [Ectobacillus ponti]MCP8968472.1 phosphatase PAP2 family protein [Ectobacillus ponti]
MRRTHVFAIAAAALAALFFSVMALQVSSARTLFVDEYMKTKLQGWESLRPFFELVKHAGAEPGVAVVLVPALIWLWRKRRIMSMLVFPAAVALTQLANKVAKGMIARERPLLAEGVQEAGYSFPSGHAMISIVLYGFLLYLIFQEKVGKPMRGIFAAAAVLLIAAVGLSRVVLSAHYPSDVLGGYCLGGIILIGCCYADYYLHARFRKQ